MKFRLVEAAATDEVTEQELLVRDVIKSFQSIYPRKSIPLGNIRKGVGRDTSYKSTIFNTMSDGEIANILHKFGIKYKWAKNKLIILKESYMKIKKLNESACWFGKYFDIHGKKKLVYISKDLTGDADEADNMMQDMISEPFTKFIFGGSVDSRMAEAEGMTLLEKKLNESTNTTDEFYDIVDTVIGPAINSIGGDMDDITGDIAQTYDEDKFFVSLYSTVPRKLANKFSKNFLNTIQTAMSNTRFSDVSLDSDRTFAYKLSRMDIHNHLGSERGDQFLSEFAMFEIGITAYGARLNEAMTIAYDKATISNMIDRIKCNREDYKSLLTEYPEDSDYWKEMIRKCDLEIAELETYDEEV